MSTVIYALGYRAIWGKIEFDLRVRNVPGVDPNPLVGPNLDSTASKPRTCIVTKGPHTGTRTDNTL